MAAAGRPVSEPYPLGGAVSLESTLSTCQERPTDAASEICQESSATPSHLSSQKAGGELGDRKQSPSEHCVPSQALSCPHTVVESHTPTHHNKIVLNVVSDNPQADRRVWSTKPTSPPISTSQSGKQGVPPPAPDSGTSGLAYHGGNTGIQEAEGHSMLACKQPMQLHQCNIITTICRGSNGGEDGPQQPPSRCVCISSSKAAAKVEGFEKEDHLPAKCDEALSYGSYIHHTNFEDTFAAYCHPQPIPAPSQVQPRHIESSCVSQCAVVPSLASFNHLSLPRLMSSVSETGLDAKHLLRGCSLSCPWITALPPGAGPQFQKHFDLEQCCSSPVGHVSTMTREMGTMTTHKELRDVGVQTGQTDTPHVFPQVCLAKESKSETSCSLTLNTDSDDGRKQGGAPKSPVKEVKWDAEGMTWEVYGASVDPEELGLAIQRHLELQIKETASRAAKLSRQNTNTSRQSGNTGCQRKRSRMMSSIRTPVCCARTTSAVD